MTLLAAASPCFLSPSAAVISATSSCINVLAVAAKARAEMKQQPHDQRTEAGKRRSSSVAIAVDAVYDPRPFGFFHESVSTCDAAGTW